MTVLDEDEFLKKMNEVLLVETDDFEELARFAGLNPGRDFREVCLEGIDLSGYDLSAFDFFGSDLRKANLSNATVHKAAISSAILTGANLDCLKELPSRGPISQYPIIDLSYFPEEVSRAIARSLEKSVKEIQIGDLIAVGSLDLNGTQVADLAALQNLSSLEKLDINGTPVTEEAVEALKEALPKLTVVS